MKRIPIALQLFSVRNELKADLHGTMEAVAEMGYEGVEFAGVMDRDPEMLRALLEKLGLECCGWHTAFADVQDERIAGTMAFNRTLGNRNIIVSSIPEERRRSRSDWLDLAQFFNRLADRLDAEDFLTGFHNHHVEFTEMEGEKPWDTFFTNTKREVIMQLDIGNAAFGGADVVQILRRYPGRAVTVHLKPFSLAKAAEDRRAGFDPLIGEDDIPWPRVFELCETTGGTEWYIVEYESKAYPPLEAVSRSLQKLRAMGK